MRIGVDATCWENRRGYGRFTRELLPVMAALAPRDSFICFMAEQQASSFDLERPNVQVCAVALGASPAAAATAEGHRALSDMFRLTRAVSRHGLDVFWSPSVYTYFPLPPSLRAVVTVHDAIAERFPALTIPSRRARLFWRLKVRLALWQARLVLTVSDYAAAEIERELEVSRSRIRVATEAPAAAYRELSGPEDVLRAAAAVGLPPGARWLMYVGGFSPHKNVELLVRAHGMLASECGSRAPHLVLVGATDGDPFLTEIPRLRDAVAESGTGALIHWTGFLPDRDVRLLHAGALALVLPSCSEGFGLPAVEAAAAGAPVIATLESPLPQLLEGGGLFITPGAVPPLLDALRLIATDEPARLEMARAARRRALDLTWERTATAVLDAVREAAR